MQLTWKRIGNDGKTPASAVKPIRVHWNSDLRIGVVDCVATQQRNSGQFNERQMVDCETLNENMKAKGAMLEILEFMFSGFWVWFGMAYCFCLISRFVFVMYNRSMRCLMVRKHG